MSNRRTPPPLTFRNATKRNPQRETDGTIIARTAELLGKPLLPWQKYINDVAGEIDPETGTYFYNTIIVTVQRQAGKSTNSLAVQVRNMMFGANRKAWYLAQTGKDAGTQFLEWANLFEKSRLSSLAHVRRSNGSMSLTFTNNSQIAPGASTDTAGHGRQGDLIIADEYWSLSLEQEKTMLDGFLATTTTRQKLTGVRPQFWILSTEGDQNSEALNKRLDDARAGLIPERTAFFDFGIPFDADPEDLETIWTYHPGSGYLFDFNQLKEFREQYKDNASGWARAFGNLRDKGSEQRVISVKDWEATADSYMNPNDAQRMCFGVAVQLGAASTTIAACIERSNQSPLVQLVETLPGIGSAPKRLKELQEKYHAPIMLDYRGPSAPLADVLRNSLDEYGYPVYKLIDSNGVSVMASAQNFVSALQDKRVYHANDEELDQSAEIASSRQVGDSWVWQRRDKAGNVAPIEAVSMAYWGYMHLEPEYDPVQVF